MRLCDECALWSGPGDALLCLFCAFVLDRLLFSKYLHRIPPYLGEPQERHHETWWGAQMKERYCSGKERNTQAASGTLCYDQGFSRNLAQCSDVSECIGMYRKVLALLFILPRMYWNVSESIGLTFHTPQNVLECIGMYWLYFSYSPGWPDTFRYIPIHSFSIKKNNQYFMSKYIVLVKFQR